MVCLSKKGTLKTEPHAFLEEGVDMLAKKVLFKQSILPQETEEMLQNEQMK